MFSLCKEETIRLSPRRTGHVLGRLGFETKRRGSWGRGLELTKAVVKQIHELAAMLGVTRADITNWMAVRAGNAGRPCKLCTECNLLKTDDGLPLRTFELPQKRRRSLFER